RAAEELRVRRFAEAVKAAPYLSSCDATAVKAAYSGAMVDTDASYDWSVTTVEHWDVASSSFSPTCPGTDSGLQRLALEVRTSSATPGRTLRQVAQLVKRAS